MATDDFEELLSASQIATKRGTIFDVPPSSRLIPWDRVEGMMLGLAIGDALGNTTEGQIPLGRRLRSGEIRDYQPNPYAGGERKGTPSDDSQMAFMTLESMIDEGHYEPEKVAQMFASRPIFGMGRTVSEFVTNFRGGTTWSSAGPASAGNGGLMRIAPVVIPHLRDPGPSLWADAAVLTMTTHNDPAAIASSVAFTVLLWELFGMREPPPSEWWRTEFVRILEDLETGETYASRGGVYAGSQGPFSQLVDTRLGHAVDHGWSTLDACEAFYSSAYLLETVPCVLYILMQCGHDPEEAIVRAVNDTYDNDTIAAIVGAAVGALHGAAGLPSRWREGLTGRMGGRDDGRMFEILEAAERRFGIPL